MITDAPSGPAREEAFDPQARTAAVPADHARRALAVLHHDDLVQHATMRRDKVAEFFGIAPGSVCK
ncbi:hypothetical protein ACFVT1_31070 [Streptomyces sp. NPDC057963]|uniref:hypothetical protein n=1 Tax=Streptomyces sp. NPDC057963 TaxID=3346290 RepID=UPI0036ED13EC